MRIIRDFTFCASECKGAVVALGNFDGVHLGHQAILEKAIALAKAAGVPSAVMTFEPHPREFFAKNKKRLRISSLHSKVKIFSDMGIDTLFLVRFNQHFASLSPESFVADVLCRNFGVSHVVTGYNFAFGKNRRGDTAFLEQQALQRGFGFSACDAVHDNEIPISSSAIRGLLAAGDVKKASTLLGRPYCIEGRVRHGQKNGQKMGFPTANLSLQSLFTPRYGIYAVRFSILTSPSPISGEPNGGGNYIYEGAANLGIKPTFDDQEPLLEVHGFDMNQNLYGKRLCVELVNFIRDEWKFDGMDALKAQIAKDCEQAKQLLSKNSSPLEGEGREGGAAI